jgi:hypothetical protein
MIIHSYIHTFMSLLGEPFFITNTYGHHALQIMLSSWPQVDLWENLPTPDVTCQTCQVVASPIISWISWWNVLENHQMASWEISDRLIWWSFYWENHPTDAKLPLPSIAMFDYQRVSASAMFKKVRVLVVVKVNCPRTNSTFVTSSRPFCSSTVP